MSLSFFANLAIWLAVSIVMILVIKDLFIDQKRFWRWYKKEIVSQDRELKEYLAKLWDIPLAQIQVAIRNFDLMGECTEYEDYGVPYFEGWTRFEFLKWYEQRSKEINGRGVDAIFNSKFRRLRHIGREIRSMLLFKS